LPDPEPAAVTLPAQWRAVDFISDLHLCPELPLTLSAWTQYLQTTSADALFILGDLFEVWVGDDALCGEFEASCAARLTEAAQRLPIWVMRGNRDFLMGPRFAAASGVTMLADPCVLQAGSHRWLLSHGDALCTDDADYQRFRRQVRDPAWQAEFLRKPLTERRQIAAYLRQQSMARQQHWDTAYSVDIDPALTASWLAAAGTDTLLHGHTHRPGSERRPEGWQRHVLSDWDLDDAKAPRAEVLRLMPGSLQRMPPSAASSIQS
jgi:UDP-2,3-diacylglucosamine hydrolase